MKGLEDPLLWREKEIIGTLCVILSLVILVSSIPAGATNYMPQEEYSFTTELPEFQVVVTYNDAYICETTEFKVSVIDKISTLPVANANVSFILPIIILETNETGVVFFCTPYISKVSAPHIRLEYIGSPNDTSYTFPLIVKKPGYKTDSTNITVYVGSCPIQD
jgi:hypothetical protein